MSEYITIKIVNDCGCCYSYLRFDSLASAEQAFKDCGMGNGMSITDDTGETFDGLDTFYGFEEV